MGVRYSHFRATTDASMGRLLSDFNVGETHQIPHHGAIWATGVLTTPHAQALLWRLGALLRTDVQTQRIEPPDGFSGSAIVMTRRAIEVLGAWEPSQQAADFHLFYQSCQRAEEHGDMRPVAVVNGIFRTTIAALHSTKNILL